MTRLTQVFSVHRFVALGFGAALFLSPEAVLPGFQREGVIEFGERFALKSWGAFVVGVAIIAHEARNFPVPAQRSVAKGLAVCFALLSGLYAQILATNTLAPGYFEGVAGTGGIFAALFLAYAWGLLGEAAGGKTA